MIRQLSLFKKKNGLWQKTKFKIAVADIKEKDSAKEKREAKENLAKKIYLKNSLLYFAVHGERWWSQYSSGETWSSEDDSGESITEGLSEIFQTEKSGSWIWIEGERNGLKHKSLETRHAGKTDLYTKEGHEHVKLSEEFFDSEYWSQESKLNEGTWIKAEEICKHGSKRNISKEQKRNLRLFCSKSNNPQT